MRSQVRAPDRIDDLSDRAQQRIDHGMMNTLSDACQAGLTIDYVLVSEVAHPLCQPCQAHHCVFHAWLPSRAASLFLCCTLMAVRLPLLLCGGMQPWNVMAIFCEANQDVFLCSACAELLATTWRDLMIWVVMVRAHAFSRSHRVVAGFPFHRANPNSTETAAW